MFEITTIDAEGDSGILSVAGHDFDRALGDDGDGRRQAEGRGVYRESESVGDNFWSPGPSAAAASV